MLDIKRDILSSKEFDERSCLTVFRVIENTEIIRNEETSSVTEKVTYCLNRITTGLLRNVKEWESLNVSRGIPVDIASSENKEDILHVFNEINEDNAFMFSFLRNSYSIDSKVKDVVLDKYAHILPEYSSFLALLEFFVKKDDIFFNILQESSDLFFQDDVNKHRNTLTIVSRFVDFNFPQEEIVYLLGTAVTLDNQMELDKLLGRISSDSFNNIDEEKFSSLSRWERDMFYSFSTKFSLLGGEEEPIIFPSGFLSGFFVEALCKINQMCGTEELLSPIFTSKEESYLHTRQAFILTIQKIVDYLPSFGNRSSIDTDFETLMNRLMETGNLNYFNQEEAESELMLFVKFFYTSDKYSKLGFRVTMDIMH